MEKIGATSVPLLTTGHEKERITVCLSALASGEKLKPFIVFRGKRFPNELNNIQGAIIMLSPNGWMNETLTAEWIKQIWGPRQTNKRMLVINTTFLHACMKKAVQNTNTIMDVVPGGSAKLIQPANVSRNAPLQGCISQIIYDTWLTSGTMERTRVAWQLTCTFKST